MWDVGENKNCESKIMNPIFTKDSTRNSSIRLFLTATVMVAAPFVTSCSNTKYEGDARSKKPRTSLNAPETKQSEDDAEKEAELLAKLPRLKEMTDGERYELLEELEKVGGEKTIKALTPFLDANWMQDSNVYSIIQTLRMLGRTNPQLILDIIEKGTNTQGGNAIRVLKDMAIDEFEKIRMLVGLYVEGGKRGWSLIDASYAIKELYKGKENDPRIMALIKKTYEKADTYGKYCLLDFLEDIPGIEAEPLLARGLSDDEANIRQMAARWLQFRRLEDPATKEALWNMAEKEIDQDAMAQLLRTMLEQHLISREDCRYEGRNSTSNDGRGEKREMR